MWIDNSIKPEEKGYYLTYYYNEEHKKHLFKAFYWGNLNNTTLRWIFRFDPDVKCYWNVRHDYYIPCQIQGNVEPLPEQYINKNNESSVRGDKRS